MRRVKEVLRLRFELGLGQRQIARSCGMGLGTVHEYLERAVVAGIGWPLPEGWGEEVLEAKLFGNRPVPAGEGRQRPEPDWTSIHQQLRQHRHLTLQLVWEEYRQANPEGYRYSWFCERYQHWRRHLDMVLRQEHKAGEKMFVDWAGATIPVYDATTGQAWHASLFVSVLGASSYTYAEATRDQQLEAWIQAHIHALEFYGGVPTLAVPDNTKTAVTRACRYDPDLSPTYQEFAVHYGMGVVPARPYRPRDKAKAESGVQVVERWIVGASKPEVLQPAGTQPGDPRVAGAIERASFPQAGRIAVQSVSQSGEAGAPTVTGGPVRHEPVVAGHRQHRLPHRLRWELLQCAVHSGATVVEVRSTPTTVEIFHKGNRIASHLRTHGRGQAITQNEHRPKSHQAHLEWPPSRMVNWARSIGPTQRTCSRGS